jgi:hypothetical protein
MPPTFVRPDLGSFCRLDELGLRVVGQRLEPGRAVLACRVIETDEFARWCRRCGCEAAPRDSVTRRLAHEPRAKLSRRALRWALEGIVCQHLTVARVAEGLGVSWNTANDAVLAEGRRVLIEGPHRFDGVRVIGVDEHCWRHTRRGDKYVTVIIDLTPIRDGTGPARLLDMVEGRSKQVFKTWLGERDTPWRDGVEVVAMDGFTGFKTATSEELPDAVAVMDPFHVVRLAGDALDQCRRRVQQATCGHRGRKGDPLYAARRTLHTGSDLLTDKQRQRLTALFTDDEHVEVEATWGIYQHMIAAYRAPDRKRGRELMQQLIGSISHSVPTVLREVITLAGPSNGEPSTCWPTSTGPAPPTGRPRRSTAASNISAAQPSASATSPTTSRDRFWRPAGSDPDYTLDHEEPLKMIRHNTATIVRNLSGA